MRGLLLGSLPAPPQPRKAVYRESHSPGSGDPQGWILSKVPPGGKASWHLQSLTGLNNSMTFWVPSQAAYSRCSINACKRWVGWSDLGNDQGLDGASNLMQVQALPLAKRESQGASVSPGLGEARESGMESPWSRKPM